MTQHLFRVDDGHRIIELTRDHLTARLKPEIAQALTQIAQSDETLRAAVQTLLSWAHELVIPVSQIVSVLMEVVAVPPNHPESMQLTIKSRHHGGFILHEVRDLKPEDAAKLTSEIRKLIAPEF